MFFDKINLHANFSIMTNQTNYMHRLFANKKNIFHLYSGRCDTFFFTFTPCDTANQCIVTKEINKDISNDVAKSSFGTCPSSYLRVFSLRLCPIPAFLHVILLIVASTVCFRGDGLGVDLTISWLLLVKSLRFRSPSTSLVEIPPPPPSPGISTLLKLGRFSPRAGSRAPSSPVPNPMPSPRLAHLAVALLLSSCALLHADAAVHDYAGERFSGDGNAFVLHGGSEGVYASAAAGAFIRCVFNCVVVDLAEDWYGLCCLFW
jgi:hypothetical protein